MANVLLFSLLLILQRGAPMPPTAMVETAANITEDFAERYGEHRLPCDLEGRPRPI